MPPLAINDFTQTRKPPRLSHIHLFLFFACALFAATLVATLIAGLWPFKSPANDAHWVSGENGIQFTEYGTALSTGVLDMGEVDACAMEVHLKPAEIWTTGTPIAFYDRAHERKFTLQQDYDDLLLRLAKGERGRFVSERSLRVQNVFRKPEFLLTVTSDGQKTTVYVDGQLVLTSPNFVLSAKYLEGRVILGNAPGRNNSWGGKIDELAIYPSELTPEQALQHWQRWKQSGQPVIDSSDKPAALYLFHEHSGSVIHSVSGSGPELVIPDKFTTVDQTRFESVASELSAHDSFIENGLINVAGFMPLGFVGALFFGCLWCRKIAAIAAILLGAATSVTIEYFQSYLPTRYSGTTDMITNILGTCLGVILYCVVAGFIPEKIRIELSRTQSG
jgi:hypothetical protein